MEESDNDEVCISTSRWRNHNLMGHHYRNICTNACNTGRAFYNRKKLPPQVKASIEAKYHLDDPVWKQYGDYLGGVITGDLGPSFKYEGRSVNDIISDAFPISAQLGLLSLMVAVVGGITAGAISAMRPNSIVDYAVTVLSTIGIIAYIYYWCCPCIHCRL